MTDVKKPTCFDCKFAEVSKGHGGSYEEPPEPASVEECNNDMVSEFTLEEHGHDPEKMPEVCGGFYPILVDNCGNRDCNKLIGQPLYSWPHFVNTMHDPVHVCGTECKQIVEDADKLERQKDARAEAEMIQMAKDLS